MTLFPAYAAAARQYGAQTAISDEGRALSYAELHTEGRCAGRALMAIGIKKGDRVAIWGVNHLDWVVAGLGIQAAGGVLVVIGTRLKGAEAGAILRRAGCKALLMDSQVAGYDLSSALAGEALPALEQRIVFDQGESWRAFMASGDAVSDEALDARIASVSPDDLADIIFTSGTTGQPKGVPMTHAQSLISCAAHHRNVFNFVAGEGHAVFFPFAHNAGYRAGWQAGLLHGTRIIPGRHYESGAVLDLLERERVSVLPLAPTLFQMLLDNPTLSQRDLSALRYASTGGATIPVPLITRMRTELGAKTVGTGYGLTEAAGSVSNTRPGDSDEVVALTAGRALNNLAVRILDREQHDVPEGEAGEIAVKGPQVLHGYYQDADATSKAFTSDGYFLTGDVGLLTPEGNLKITDRIKDMYLCGGFNCYPAEIEGMLRGHAAVADVAVVGVHDARLGEVGCAFVVVKPGTVLDESALIAWAKPQMANYKVPRTVVFVPSLPLNATGKVNKVELRKRNAL